jgi:SsrA-binding protein
LKKPVQAGERVVAQNRAAGYNYHLLEKFEAGMVLLGTEVKSLRHGQAGLREAYAEIRNGEVWLVNCHIPEYQPGGPFNHAPLRTRKLLLRRLELRKLIGKTAQKGLTLIPLRIYFKNGRAKCELALARGKKQWDRRAAEREKEARRETEDAIYHSRRRSRQI